MHNEAAQSRLNIATVGAYAGAVLVILAMARFMTMNFEGMHGGWVTAMASVYAIVFASAGTYLWYRKSAKRAGGLLVTIGVWMVPIAVYGVQKAMGLWIPRWSAHTQYYIDHKNVIVMALGTVAASLLALRYVKFPFLTTPIIICLWAITGSTVALVRGDAQTSFHEMNIVTVAFGFATMCASVLIGKVFREDFGFWFNLVGAAFFWFAVTLGRSGDTEFEYALIYGLTNLGLIAIGILIRRQGMLFFGGMGLFIYAVHYSREALRRSPLYFVAVFLSGAAVVLAAVEYRKHRAAIDAFATRLFPWRASLVPDRAHVKK